MNNSLIKLIRGKGAILNYHRVLPANKIDNSIVNISVSVNNFINQINYLKKNFDIISLDDLLVHLKSKSNKFKIAITFDDGYKDNLKYAYPILERFKAPATIYVITKFIGNKCMPWWIKLDHFIKNNNVVGNKKIKFNFFKNDLLFDDQLNIDNKVSSFIGNNYKLKRTIGSHSHSHYNFSQLTQEQALSELKISKSILEKIIKKKILHFSYPYGGYENINFRHTKLLKNLGYLSAVTTIRKKLYQLNQFELPRVFVNNDNYLFRLKLKLLGFRKFY